MRYYFNFFRREMRVTLGDVGPQSFDIVTHPHHSLQGQREDISSQQIICCVIFVQA